MHYTITENVFLVDYNKTTIKYMANLKLINELLRQKKITKKDFCNDIGLTDTALRLITDRNSTKTETIERIAQALNVPVGYFFGETDNHTTCNVANNSLIKKTDEPKEEIVESNQLKNISEINFLHKEIEYLKSMIEEKERTIQILLNK